MAERIASELKQSVLLVDRRPQIGGNAYDYTNKHGVLVHKYGAHIFHTNAPSVAQYLSRFTQWQPYEHKVLAQVDGQFVPLPINFNSIEMIFGESDGQHLNKLLADEFGVGVNVPILKMRQSSSRDVRRVADLVYEKVFLNYNLKQWGLSPEQLDPSVSGRVPVRLSRDDRFFQDNFQNMPVTGYTAMFERMLDNPLIEVQLNADYRQIANSTQFARLVYTGPIDEFFDYKYGPLPYRSLKFETKTKVQNSLIQQVGQQNYPTPAQEHPFTRTIEFRHLTGQNDVDATTQVFEYSEAYVPGANEPYYPVPREENQRIFRKYQTDAKKLKTVVFAGRLADYRYYNMDQAAARALSCFQKQILSGVN